MHRDAADVAFAIDTAAQQHAAGVDAHAHVEARVAVGGLHVGTQDPAQFEQREAAMHGTFGGVLAGHFDVGLGVSAYMLFSLNQPQWRNEHTALAGLPTATTAAQSDGFANFPGETTAGSFVLAIVPGLDVRYAF